MGSETAIILHSNEWDLSDIEGIVWLCQQRAWTKRERRLSPALVSKDRLGSRPYFGEEYDPELWDLAPHGWDHDHCAICLWTLTVSDNPEEGTGWTNEDHGWLCNECYEKLIRPQLAAENEP